MSSPLGLICNVQGGIESNLTNATPREITVPIAYISYFGGFATWNYVTDEYNQSMAARMRYTGNTGGTKVSVVPLVRKADGTINTQASPTVYWVMFGTV